jgi:hypothetical protein
VQHDLWLRPGVEDGPYTGDSVAKLLALLEVADTLDIDVTTAQVSTCTKLRQAAALLLLACPYTDSLACVRKWPVVLPRGGAARARDVLQTQAVGCMMMTGLQRDVPS